MQNLKNHNQIQNDEPTNDEVDNDEEDATDNDGDAEEYDDVDDDEEETESDDEIGDVKNTNLSHDNNSNGNEFIEIGAHGSGGGNGADDDDGNGETIGQLKKPGGGGNNKRRKKKKGNQQHELASQAANLLIVQPLEHQLTQQHDDGGIAHKVKPIRNKGKPLKQKRRKRKKKGQALDDDSDTTATVVVEQQPSSDHLSLGLLEALADVDVLDGGGKRKKHPMKYGRSNGGVCLNNFCAPFPYTPPCSTLVALRIYILCL